MLPGFRVLASNSIWLFKIMACSFWPGVATHLFNLRTWCERRSWQVFATPCCLLLSAPSLSLSLSLSLLSPSLSVSIRHSFLSFAPACLPFSHFVCDDKSLPIRALSSVLPVNSVHANGYERYAVLWRMPLLLFYCVDRNCSIVAVRRRVVPRYWWTIPHCYLGATFVSVC